MFLKSAINTIAKTNREVYVELESEKDLKNNELKAAKKAAKKTAKQAGKTAESAVVKVPTFPAAKAESTEAAKTVKKYSADRLARVDELMPVLTGNDDQVYLEGMKVVCAVGVKPNRARLIKFIDAVTAQGTNAVEFLGLVEKFLLASPLEDLVGVEERLERVMGWGTVVQSVAKEVGVKLDAYQLSGLAVAASSAEFRTAVVMLYWHVFGDGDTARRFLRLEEYDNYLTTYTPEEKAAFIERMQSSNISTGELLVEMKEYVADQAGPEAERVAPETKAEPAVVKPTQAEQVEPVVVKPVQAPHPQQPQPQVQMGKRNKGKPIAVQPAKQPVPYSSTMGQVVPPATLKAHSALQADPLFTPVDMEVLADVTQRLQQGGLDLSNESFSQEVLSAYKLEVASRAEAIARGSK